MAPQAITKLTNVEFHGFYYLFQINPSEPETTFDQEAWKSSLGLGNIQDLIFKQDFNENLTKALDKNFEKVTVIFTWKWQKHFILFLPDQTSINNFSIITLHIVFCPPPPLSQKVKNVTHTHTHPYL